MNRAPIITNFKRPIFQTFIKLILYENDVKLSNLREVLYRSICDMFEV